MPAGLQQLNFPSYSGHTDMPSSYLKIWGLTSSPTANLGAHVGVTVGSHSSDVFTHFCRLFWKIEAVISAENNSLSAVEVFLLGMITPESYLSIFSSIFVIFLIFLLKKMNKF